MRYIRIASLCLQRVFHERGKAFVWFLISLVGNGSMLLFWYAALQEKAPTKELNITSIQSYYVLLLTAGSLLMSHVETAVADVDIGKGELSKYLVRPFPYFWIRFLEEFPWRLLTGAFGLFTCIVLSQTIVKLELTSDPGVVFLVFCMAILATFISFVLKMIVGLTAFWLTSIRALKDLIEISLILGAGYTLPLYLFPEAVSQVLYATPLPYMIYFPVVSLMGKLTYLELFQVLAMQCFWLSIVTLLYHFVFSQGIRKFSGVGQ